MAGNPTPPTATTPNPSPPAAVPPTGGELPGAAPVGTPSATPPASTTTDTVPTWLPERLERASRSGQEAALKALGFKDLTEAQTRLAALSELEQKGMNELELAKLAATNATNKLAELEAWKTRVETENRQREIESSRQAMATTAGVAPTMAKYAMLDLDNYIQASPPLKALLDANQVIPAEYLQPFWDGLKKTMPHFFTATPVLANTGSGTPPPTPPAPGSTGATPKMVNDMTDAEKADYGRKQYGIG